MKDRHEHRHAETPAARRLEEELDRALAELPREGASPGFTERLLERLEAPLEDTLEDTAEPSWRPSLHPFWRPLSRLLPRLRSLLRPVLHPSPAALAGGLALAGLAVLLLVAFLAAPGGGIPSQPPAEAHEGRGREQLSATLDQLRREHLRLERDLRDLRQLAEDSRRIYLGGDETLDLVLEVAPSPGGTAPAAFDPHPGTPGPSRPGDAGGGRRDF